jgi:mannonate dehydratase
VANFNSNIPRGPRFPDRRDVLKLPLMAAAAAAYGMVPSSARALSLSPLAVSRLPQGVPVIGWKGTKYKHNPLAVSRPSHPDEDTEEGTKIAVKIFVPRTTNEDLLFLRQIGLRWLHADFGTNASYEDIRRARERFAQYDLKIDCALNETYRSLKIQLGQPGRDEDIDKFNTFLTDCGRLGIRTAHIDFHPGNTYTTNMVTTPRGYMARQFSVADFRQKVEERRFDRDYSADDMWANFSYFLKAVLPVAEKANIKLAQHPDDPPITPMNGVAKLFIDNAGYQHAADVVAGGSKAYGLCLCLGTWLEGGTTMGLDPAAMIHYWAGRGQLNTIHFRNVSSPLPVFNETFQDDGYADLYQLMKALVQVRSTAPVSCIPDHYPGVVSDTNRRIDNAYMVSLMRQMLRRAYDEVG